MPGLHQRQTSEAVHHHSSLSPRPGGASAGVDHYLDSSSSTGSAGAARRLSSLRPSRPTELSQLTRRHRWRRQLTLACLAFLAIALVALILARSLSPATSTAEAAVKDLDKTKYSIVVSTYRRAAHLQSLLDNYATGDLPRLAAVHVAWGLGDVPPPDWLMGPIAAGKYAVPITFEKASVNSLTERFRIPPSLTTRAVLAIDDDLRFGPGDIEFAFSVWQEYGLNQSRIVGFSPRDWNIDAHGEYHYQNLRLFRYSIILTNAAFMDVKFLHWFWEDDDRIHRSIEYVDENMNCEDILMNFVVSAKTGGPPLYVRAHPVNVASSGLSQLQGHYDARTMCMREFIRIWGMPLKRTDVTLKRGGLDLVRVEQLESDYAAPELLDWGSHKDFVMPGPLE